MSPPPAKTTGCSCFWIRTQRTSLAHILPPDHPCYGNGGDPDKVQHPFGSYDPEKHEIVIVDNETIKQLKQESSSTGKSLLTLVNEEYKVNKKKTEPYVPLHSGRFLKQDGQQVMHMIETLPAYIKVRKLEKFSAGEKSEREAQRQAEQEEYEQEKQKKEKYRARAMKKLKDIGLTEDEIKALF